MYLCMDFVCIYILHMCILFIVLLKDTFHLFVSMYLKKIYHYLFILKNAYHAPSLPNSIFDYLFLSILRLLKERLLKVLRLLLVPYCSVV